MPTATISIPTALRTCVNGRSRLAIEGDTIAEVFERLFDLHGGLRRLMLDETGALRRYVNVYLGRELVRDPVQTRLPLEGDCEIRIVPSMAGG